MHDIRKAVKIRWEEDRNDMNKVNGKSSIRLMAPEVSQTDTSITLLWDKPEDISGIAAYQIDINGEITGSSEYTDYTVTNLASGQEYAASVSAVTAHGEILISSDTITVKTKQKAEIFDITRFGAVGDGITNNTRAIQSAIDACTSGGRVNVPSGIFVSGAIFLKSNMTLYIEEGGILLGSEELLEYPLMEYRFEGLETTCYASLINTKGAQERLENITIAGPGKIDANGSKLRKKELAEKKGKPGRAVCIRNTDRVYLHNITVKQSPAWCVHLIYCTQVAVNDVKIFTKWDEDGTKYPDIVNGDGLNPDSSKDVFIFHTMISSQDDCIAIKSGRNEEGRRVGIPSENIRITNCTFKSGFGVAVGSEMSGGVRNVLVQDCRFENTYSFASIKAPRGRGGMIENIVYKDIVHTNYSLEHHDCEWFRGALNIDHYYSHKTYDPDAMEEKDEGTPVIRDIIIEKISLDTWAGNAIFLNGLPESLLQNVHLKEVKATGKYGMIANNVSGLRMEQVTVEANEGEDFRYHNVAFD